MSGIGRLLITVEVNDLNQNACEHPTRAYLDATLAPWDLFIGLQTLTGELSPFRVYRCDRADRRLIFDSVGQNRPVAEGGEQEPQRAREEPAAIDLAEPRQ